MPILIRYLKTKTDYGKYEIRRDCLIDISSKSFITNDQLVKELILQNKYII